MAVSQFTIERFSITSAKPFADVVKAIESSVGHPEIRQFLSAIHDARDDQELQRMVRDVVGPTELMEFMRFDQGDVLRHELGPGAPKVIRLLIGNPVTMRKMAKHVHDAGSYAPVTILVDERSDGVHVSYDRMASLLSHYENQEALSIARALDANVESILTAAAQ